LLFAAYEVRILPLLSIGEIAQADLDIAAASEIAMRLRTPTHEYAALRFQLGRALADGQLESARALLERVRVLGSEAGDPGVEKAHQIVQVWLLSLEGRSAIARASVESLAERGQLRDAAGHAFAASFWSEIGDRRLATQHFEQAAARDFEDLPVDDDWLWNLCTCADACARLLDDRRAKLLYERIAPYAQVNVTNRLYLYRGAAAQVLGRLALVMGDVRAAWAGFETALECNRRIGGVALVSTQHEYGRALLRGTPQEQARGRALLECGAAAPGEPEPPRPPATAPQS
jgi:hypothetical protein